MYERTIHLPFSHPGNADLLDLGSGKLLKTTIVGTEKLDGSTVELGPARVWVNSENTIHPHLLNINRDLRSLLKGEVYVYGEWLKYVHAITYKHPHPFYLFAVKEIEQGKVSWWSWAKVQSLACQVRVASVPVLVKPCRIGTIEELKQVTKFRVLQGSSLTGECEGIVWRTASAFTDFAANVRKYVRKDHVQTLEHWSQQRQLQPLCWNYCGSRLQYGGIKSSLPEREDQIKEED